MNLFTDLFNRKSSTVHGPSSGLYHYTRETEHEKSRIHLRVDADGHGTLIVNANSVMHLNPTATFMAWLILEALLDHILKVDFRNTRWMVISYVVLFFAGTGGLLGIASNAGRAWKIAAIILFLIMAVLTFVQRAVTGM